MEKKKIIVKVGEAKTFDAARYIPDYTDINEAIEFFVTAKNNGATHISWIASAYDESSFDCEAQPFYEREETDEELKQREFDEQCQAELQRQKELRIYEGLKLKFENSSNK